MIQIKNIICIAVCLFAIIENLHGADDYTDENRPYEFGFTIDGEQHRHEKKDKNGIIMGEFGFITADGVYHVTVYATDENGRFKILSMKNIRVKPYPTAPGVKKGHSLPFPPSENAPVLQGPKEQKEIKLNKPLAASPAKSCSHCSLPTTTTTTKAPQLSDIAVVATNPQTPSSPGETASKQGGLNHGFVPQNNQQYQQNHPEQLNSDLGSLQPQNIGQKIPEIGSQLGQSPPQDESTVEMHSSVQGSSIEQSNLQNPQVIQKANDQQNYSPQQNYVNANNGLSGIVTDSEYPKSQQQSISNGNHPQNTYVGTGKDNHSQKGNTDLNNYPQEKSSVNQNNYPQQGVTRDRDDTYTQHATTLNQPQSPPTKDSVQNYPGSATATQQSPNPQDNNPRNPKQYNDISSVGIAEVNQPQGSQNGIANKPTLIAAQMQIVPKNTDIHHKGPGEQEGLPDGVSKDDVTNLLYTFNYTVGFHGHHEEGYTNGAKQGYYYVTGRNGIRTRVDYVADEKGFRPRISQIALDVLSDDVPKPETEKDEKFGLKGYEFKWLYYPADNKPQ